MHRIQLKLLGGEDHIVEYVDSAGIIKTEKEVEDLVRTTLHEMSSWELIDIIENEVSLMALEYLAKDENGNWYED